MAGLRIAGCHGGCVEEGEEVCVGVDGGDDFEEGGGGVWERAGCCQGATFVGGED